MRAFMSALALTAILAVCKAAGVTDVSWVWIASPFWIPFGEGVLMALWKFIDRPEGQ